MCGGADSGLHLSAWSGVHSRGAPTANPLFNAFINIIVEEALNSLGNSCGFEVLWKADNRLHRTPQPDGDAQHLLVTLLMLADDLALTAESVEQAQRFMDAFEAARQRWGMEISLQKTETMVLDPRRSKAAQHSRGGSIQSASQPTALMTLLSLLLIAVLAITLPLPPAVCIIAATGLCCCVVLMRILLALSYSLSSHSPPLPAAIPTSLPPAPPTALRRQQPAANHHHQPPNAQPQLQPTASPQPTAPRPISLHGHKLPYVQHFRYLGSYFSADCSLDKEISWRLTAAGAAVQRAVVSGAAGRSPLAPKRGYMAAWCFQSCCMEQSPCPSRPPSCSGLRFSIVGASAFWGCACAMASARGASAPHTAVQYWHHHPPPPSAVARPCHAHAWRASGTASPVWTAYK
jgi:hypothetical protein